MSQHEVTAVLRAQRRSQQPKSFAALAVEYGYLTEHDAMWLSKLVRQRQVSLPDMLIKMGAVSYEQLEDEWRLYDRNVRAPIASGEVVSRLAGEQAEDEGERGAG